MATVIYLPKTKSIGEAAGEAFGAYVGRQQRDKEKEEKAKQLSELFSGLTAGGDEGNKAAKDAIASGAITNTSDLISLVGQMRKNKNPTTIKIPAFNAAGNEVPFAVDKNDLATGDGEAKANLLGLTLINKGKQVDFFEDSISQKFVGVGSANNRPEGKITLDEWKSKYASTGKGKPTDKDKAIRDYLKGSKDTTGNALQNTSINRKRAREFLDKRGKAIEVINAAFGKKTGNDWTIDDPLKNQMAIIAKMQVERLIMTDGLSAEQAGSQSVIDVKDLYKDKIDAAGEPITIEEESGGFIKGVKDFFTSDETKAADEVRESPNYIGDFNKQPIEIPDEITSPAEAMEYIMKEYKMSKEDARQFLLDNQPTE